MARVFPRRLTRHPHKSLAQPSTRADCLKDFSPYPPNCHGKWFSAFSPDVWALGTLSDMATWIRPAVRKRSRFPDQVSVEGEISLEHFLIQG